MEEKYVNPPSCESGGGCPGEVISSVSCNECTNTPSKCQGYAKIPIVLGEFTVQIDVESKIKLCEPAIEIKRIKKNIYLTQCRLIAGTCKLFLKGFVRKNIEYATKDCTKKDVICGAIKQTTVYVPFECVTKVDLKNYPKFHYNPQAYEVDYFDKKVLGRDTKEQDFITSEYFNEKVYCELEHAKIYEADIVEDGLKVECHPVEHLFDSFIEKEVILLKLKLLQNQQIYHKMDYPPPIDPKNEKDMVMADYE